MDLFVRNGEEPYMQFSNFKLRSYFPHEVDKLSVLRITQTKTFDEVGHPISGGLYDPILGPDNTFDQCLTCHQYERHCPGHMGHIQLAVPVFNPLLFQFTYNLLKGSCVHCHRLTCKGDGVNARMLLAQLRCFELGVEHVAFDLESILRDKIVNADLFDDDDSKAFVDVDIYIAQLAGKPLAELNKFQSMPTKNSVQLKRDLITEFLRSHLFKRLQKCPLCKNRNGVLRNDGARSILLDFTGSRGKSKKLIITGENGFNEESSSDEDEKKPEEKNVDVGSGVDTTEGSLEMQMKNVKSGECDKLAWRGAEVREHFRMLFKNDGKLLLKLFPMLIDELNGADMICPLDGLFLERILVPPKKFRPIRMFKGSQYEDPQTLNLRKVLEATETISAISLIMKGDKSAQLKELVANRVRGKTINAQMHDAYLQLQLRANAIFDQDLNKGDRDSIAGIKQILEKKQGLFRMHMMGKRVNFACRSVITPDPYLDIDEIGIPDIFAKKLTFTEPVNVFNLKEMKGLVRNGPHEHPGANFYVEPSGKKTMLGNKPEEKKRRMQIAKTMTAATTESLRQTPKVLRHMKNGDMIMMNRQPSLHKPSIMGHRARVLTGQRALRMNYAPCKAYNADFDGDEMNGHLVQSHIAQTEVREIANVGSNFLVPKDATPLLGLIQDHVVSGVLLTLRDRFLNKEDFMHLVLASFAQYSKRIEIPPPTILYPKRLWTGKQVVTTIVKNCIPENKPLINLDGKAKTPLSCWVVPGHQPPPFEMSESHVVFRQGELLVGVLDKAHFGATQFGLAHCAFELYGHRCGVQLLSCFSRLFTTYLQVRMGICLFFCSRASFIIDADITRRTHSVEKVKGRSFATA
uniref:DNA-directed RNA polymerase subunit n=1 Tax=Caenorhabditis japonica TaxID=281687 RepID=A0A8R1HYD6_CAEJA